MSQPLNVLLVEDDEVDVLTMERVFRKVGGQHTLFTATDGRMALEMLRSGQVPPSRRLVLTDLKMARGGGLELIREIREDPRIRTTVVVIFTTSADERDRRRGFELGISGYLIKPIDMLAMVERITLFLNYWAQSELA